MKAIDWDQTAQTMNESGVHDTRRGAKGLARFPPGSGEKAKSMRPRFLNMVAPGWFLNATPGIDRGAR